MASLRLIACLALASCYDVPRPECGFQCGPAGECPDGYSCFEDRCRLDTDYPFSCPAIMDPPIHEMIPPKIQSRQPTPGDTNVDLDVTVLVTFDEGVTGVDASTFGLTTDTGFVMGVVTVASIGRAFRFTPQRPLRPNKVYEVVLGNAIRDLVGNALPETRWTFSTIEDRTPPMVVSSSPVDGATGVSTMSGFSVSFDEDITGVDANSVRLEQAGTPMPLMFATVAPNIVSATHAELLGETVYTIVLSAGIEDLGGNPLTPTMISFTTRDTTPPSLVSRDPLPDATDVPATATVSITFSEPLGDQDIFLSQGATAVDTAFADTFNIDGTYTITLTPTAPLAPSTIYTVHLGVVRDNSNNATTLADYTFTTAP